MHKRPHSLNRVKTAGFILLVLLVAGAAYGLYYFKKHDPTAYQAVTTSKTKTAQSSYDEGKARSTNSSGSQNDGGAVDLKGQADTSSLPNSSQWTSSSSGVITLQQPVKGATVKDGDVLSGTATVDVVQYRIVDDKYGVIGQGSLDVINGKFAGTLQFNSSHTTGSIVIYSSDKTSGAEINNIKIQVRFE